MCQLKGNRDSGAEGMPKSGELPPRGLLTWDPGPLLLQAASSKQELKTTHPAQGGWPTPKSVTQICHSGPLVPWILAHHVILFSYVRIVASWGHFDPLFGLPALKHLAYISMDPNTWTSICCRVEAQCGCPEWTDG